MESVAQLTILLVLFEQNLENHRAAERLILGKQDRSHRTFGVWFFRIGDRIEEASR